jgi:rubrerythrin
MVDKDSKNSIETDIALIKKDISQIEKVFKKVDDAISQMSEILRDLAVQETVLENNEKRLEILEKRLILHTEEEKTMREEFRQEIKEIKQGNDEALEKRHLEIVTKITAMHEDLNSKLDKQDKRIQSLENWRWYLLGAAAVIGAVIFTIPWEVFFS